jgi:uncharacterized metal-binding protein
MPSGRTHESINLLTYGAAAVAYAYARQEGLTAEFDTLLAPETLKTFTLCYLIGTFLITPDMDLAENRMQARNNWGILGVLWIPYGALFSHRGLSHSWIIGPLTRLVYMALIGMALWWGFAQVGPYFGYTFSFRAELNQNWQELAIGALAGYYLSQWLHLVADGIQPDHGAKKAGTKTRRRSGGRSRVRR